MKTSIYDRVITKHSKKQNISKYITYELEDFNDKIDYIKEEEKYLRSISKYYSKEYILNSNIELIISIIDEKYKNNPATRYILVINIDRYLSINNIPYFISYNKAEEIISDLV